MMRYYDPTGFARTAKAWTEDGFRYPFTAMEHAHKVKWTDEILSAPQVLEVNRVWIHCGPDAPYPLVPTPDQILDSALNLDEARPPAGRVWLGWF